MKKSLTIIIVLVLVLVGGGLIFMGSGGKLPFGGGGEEGADEGAPEEQGFIGKIADALKRETAMKCTYQEGDQSATFYLKGGKLRGEVSMGDDEMLQYIFRDNCMYYWSEAESEGMKMCWEASEAPDWEESMQAAAQEFNCQPQTIPDSMFSLPSGVEFMDMSEYMQQMPTE